MQYPVYLPNVELNMEGITVTSWLVAVGDMVAAEQPLLEVETQKATVEVPSPRGGYVRALHVEAGADVAEKALLCTLTDEADEPFDAQPLGIAAPDSAQMSAAGPNSQPAAATGPVPASPAARKLARDKGLDLGSVRGTGPNGRITEDDVAAALNSAPKGEPADETEWITLPASRVALNQQMHKALAEIPQITVTRQMDVTPLVRKMEGITFTHRLVVAAAAALKAHPALRTSIDGNRVKAGPVSVAIAMDTAHGLVAPVVRDAANFTLEQVSAQLTALRARAEANALRREEMMDGPFAITNLGALGIDFFQPLVFHGQTAVLAVGRARDAGPGRKACWFSLAVDHRLVDGAEAARFLQTLQKEIGAA